MSDSDEEINNSDDGETPEEPKKPRIDQRINKLLTDKQEAEELVAKANKAADKARLEAETAKKDLEFYQSFNTVSGKYQGSAEYQEQIRERVNKGYDLEEATVAVMAKEGKYTPPAMPKAPVPSPAGGSAPTTLHASADKPIGEMTQDERRAQLMEAERRGDIALG